MVQGCICADLRHLTEQGFVCLRMSHTLPLACTVRGISDFFFFLCLFIYFFASHVLASAYLLGMLSTSHRCTLPLSPARQERLT